MTNTPTALELLQFSAHPTPAWAHSHGGPLEIARAIPTAQREATSTLAALRASALAELAQTMSVAQIARELGISRQAVHTALQTPAKDISW